MGTSFALGQLSCEAAANGAVGVKLPTPALRPHGKLAGGSPVQTQSVWLLGPSYHITPPSTETRVTTCVEVCETARPPAASSFLSSQRPRGGGSKPRSARLGQESRCSAGGASLRSCVGHWELARAGPWRGAGVGVLRGPLSDGRCETGTTGQRSACSGRNGVTGSPVWRGPGARRASLHLWGRLQPRGTHRMKVRGFWSRLRDWRSLRGSSPCQGNPLMVLMIWSCKSLRGGGGNAVREKTELEQWAHHLGVPSTVGSVPRPLEPKHAAGGACTSLPLPSALRGFGQEWPPTPRRTPSSGARGPLRAKWILQHGMSDH